MTPTDEAYRVSSPAMSRNFRAASLLTALLAGCATPVAPAAPPAAYGYELDDDPLADTEGADAKRLTSCADVRCPSPKVCRLLSLTDPGGVAHPYCLGQGDDLCKLDPELCRDDTCRTSPGLCK